MIVIDASVTSNALIYADERGRRARSVLARDPEWTVPNHWSVEVFATIRGLTIGGKISAEHAVKALSRLRRLSVDEVSIADLLPRMWQLHQQISAYDAPYVALAEARQITLVTSDARLARAAVRYCRVEQVG